MSQLPRGYEPEDLLKESAHVRVVVARPLRGRGRVAVKLVDAEAPETVRDSFLEDVRLRGELVHDGISPVLESGRLPGGALYAISPFVEKTDPHRWIARAPEKRAVAFIRRVAEPLVFLHERGHLHGDIKPSNLLFRAERDAILDLRLTDFLPRAFRRESAFGMLVGTLAYLAPEAIRGEEIDHRADLYSLGATLFEILTGRPLFAGDAVELARSHLTVPVGRLLPSSSPIPKGVWEAIGSLLEKEPADRPGSASLFLDAIAGKHLRPESVILPSVPPFVGRRETLDRFRSWLGGGERPCFLVTGPRGSGRTRLLRRLVNELRFEGRSVFAVTAPEAGTARPFDGARRLFEAAGAGPLTLPSETRRVAGWAREPHLLRTSNVEIRHFRRLRDGWEARVRALATEGAAPPVVVIDDMDRLDDISFRWVLFLIGRSAEPAVRFVLSRAGGGAPSGGDPFAELEERGQARVEHLEPLDREEVRAWLQGTLGAADPPDELVDAAHGFSGGNPARLDAIVRGWVRRGSIRRHRGGLRLHERRPLSVVGEGEATPALETKEYSARQRELLGAIALSSAPRSARFLERILTIAPYEFPGQIGPLIEAGLVRREASGKEAVYALTSEDHRDAASRFLPDRRAKGLHRAAARLLEEEGADGDPASLGEAALHWEKAGLPSVAGRALLRAAAGMEEAGLPRQAAGFYRRAFRIMGGTHTPIERAKVLYALASLRQREGEPRAALAALRLLGRRLPPEPRGETLRREAARLAAWIRYFQGKPEAAEASLTRLLAEADKLEEREEAAVRCDLGWFALSRGDAEKARGHLTRVLFLLKGSSRSILKGRALNRLGAVAFYESKWRDAATFYERAGRLLERVAPAEAVGALANLALVHLWTGSLGAAREVLTKARAEARRGADSLEEARIDEDLARVLFRLGDGAEAARVLDEAESAYEDFGDSGGSVRVLLTRGQMARERGRLDLSLELLPRGLALAREGANPFALFDALHLLALTHLARGEREEAGAALGEARIALGERLAGRYEALLERAEARLAPGRVGTKEAEKKLDRAIRHFLKRGERLMAAETMLQAAQIRLDSPGRTAPRALLRRAESLMKEGECPWVSCRLALLGGRCAERRADLPEAASLYREAVRISRGLDARLDLAEALARLGALSARRGERRRARSYVEEATSLYDRVRIVVPPAPLAEARALLQAPEEEGGESFRVLCRIAEIINSLRDSEAILNHVLDQALDHLRAERGLVLVYGPGGDLVPRVARSLDGTELEDATRFSRTLFRRAEESEEPLVADNALADPRFEGADSISTYNILSVASAPLRSRGKPLGLIYVDNCRSTNLFSPTDVSFLVALANLAGVALENARLLEDLERENTLLKSEALRSAGDQEIVAVSTIMKRTLEQLRTAARSDITVLLLGETGTGKGLAAQFLHAESARRDQPFLRLNCSAVAPTLVEDELFGHDRGAFTDATGRKPGIFERANGGTLLLDEIGDMPLPAQSKLLRVLQEGEFERLGGVQTIRTNIRIIAATNRSLAELVAKGEFREDLYYRLNVVAVELPPLRSRREDIPPLARIFLDRHARQNRKEIDSISGAAEGLLRSYDWPGNVRELDHVIERGVVFCDGRRIEVGHLAEEVRAAFPADAARVDGARGAWRDLQHELHAMEGKLLRDVLQRSGWNRSEAARMLGVHESTVRKKIQLHHLDRFHPRKSG